MSSLFFHMKHFNVFGYFLFGNKLLSAFGTVKMDIFLVDWHQVRPVQFLGANVTGYVCMVGPVSSIQTDVRDVNVVDLLNVTLECRHGVSFGPSTVGIHAGVNLLAINDFDAIDKLLYFHLKQMFTCHSEDKINIIITLYVSSWKTEILI